SGGGGDWKKKLLDKGMGYFEVKDPRLDPGKWFSGGLENLSPVSVFVHIEFSAKYEVGTKCVWAKIPIGPVIIQGPFGWTNWKEASDGVVVESTKTIRGGGVFFDIKQPDKWPTWWGYVVDAVMAAVKDAMAQVPGKVAERKADIAKAQDLIWLN